MRAECCSPLLLVDSDPNADAAPIYSQRIGGVGRTIAGDMVVDCSGNVMLAATSSTADLPATSDALQVRSAGGKDVLLVQFSTDGGLTSLSCFGGEKDEIAAALAMDPGRTRVGACRKAQGQGSRRVATRQTEARLKSAPQHSATGF